MYKKLLKIFVLFLLFGVLFFPDSSFAFKSVTRDQLIYDAIEFSPAELQAYLRDNLIDVRGGSHFAERHRRRSYSVDPDDTQIIYKQLIQDLKARSYDDFNTPHAFGVLACFIAETISPDNYRTPSQMIPDDVSYDGYQEVGDVNSNITVLIENYRIPYRRRMEKDITDQLYKVAVNEIVDYWVSAWEASGHQTGRFADTGKKINHQIIVPKSKKTEEKIQ
jgi:hypothetical protein